MDSNLSAARVERVDRSVAKGTGLVRWRNYFGKPRSPGDMLSRLWALYGPPDSVGFEGFDYTFRDRETGLVFTAYSAGSDPAFGGHRQDIVNLSPVLDTFEELVNATRPAECEIQHETAYGILRSGARDGVPFDELMEPEE